MFFLFDISEGVLTWGAPFFGVEAVRTMLEFRRLISRYLVNNPYLRQDDMT